MLRGEGLAPLGRASAWPRLVALAITMIAFVATPPAVSSAAVQCSYSAQDHVLAVSVTGAFEIGEIVRSGSQIVPRESPFDDPPQCNGAPAEGATVFNTDRVHITSKKDSSMNLELSGGPFAPGATDEGDGSPEIEFEARGPDPLGFVVGTSGRDVFTWGTDGGVNLNPGLNGDTDSDVINRGGWLAGTTVDAAGGPDLIAPQAGFVGGSNQSWGGSGNDVLRGATNGSILDGGRGNDTLIGGKGPDYIIGGGGRDTIRAGKKSDLIEVADGRAETVFCGGGRDKGKADPVDKLRGCEQVRRTSRRRAAASSDQSDAARMLRLWAH